MLESVVYKAVLEDTTGAVGPGANIYRRWKGANFYCPTASGNMAEFAGTGTGSIMDSIDLFEGPDGGTGTWLISSSGNLWRLCSNAGGTVVKVTGDDNEFQNWVRQDTFTIDSAANRTVIRRMQDPGGAVTATITNNGVNTRFVDCEPGSDAGTGSIYAFGDRLTMTAAPTSSNPWGHGWKRGSIVYAADPASLGFIGWVCTVAGTPGTWKTFGAVTP